MNIDELKARIEASPRVIIYGAGRYAKAVHTFFELHGYLDKLQGFVVSRMDGNPSAYQGVPVKPFDAADRDTDALWVIAVKGSVGILSGGSTASPAVITPTLYDAILTDIYCYYEACPIVNNRIFFLSYNGLGYGCNPKYIAEEIIRQGLNFDMVWAVKDEAPYVFPDAIRTVVIGSASYYRALCTSKFVVDNCCSFSRYPKRSGQYLMETWHGCAPLKKVAFDAHNRPHSSRAIAGNIDVYLAGTGFYAEQFRKAFSYQGEIANTGCPRDDILFQKSDAKEKVYRQYGIPAGAKVVLYAPTFRDDDRLEGYDIQPEAVVNALQERFGGEFVFAYRLHHRLYASGLSFSSEAVETINMTFYDDVQELIAAFDVLITDYSSIMWDFSLTGKPVFLYHADADCYEMERGFYTPFHELPYPIGRSHDELCRQILHFDEEKYSRRLTAFQEKTVVFDDGHASQRAVAIIQQQLQKSK